MYGTTINIIIIHTITFSVLIYYNPMTLYANSFYTMIILRDQ